MASMASSISFPTEGSFALSNWRYSQRAVGGTKNTFSARYSSLSSGSERGSLLNLEWSFLNYQRYILEK
jgi:hypothetical protein